MPIGSRWIKYQQIALLNVKSAIHHLIPNKDLKSMENMLHTEGKAVVGNNICLSPFFYTCLYHLRNDIFSSYVFKSALPKRTEKSLHHIKTILYFDRSVL